MGTCFNPQCVGGWITHDKEGRELQFRKVCFSCIREDRATPNQQEYARQLSEKIVHKVA